MKNIVLFGAGMSASTLIKYLLDNSVKYNWKLIVCSHSIEHSKEKIEGHPNGVAMGFDISQVERLEEAVKLADIVISFLPAYMHINVLEQCIKHKKNMLTASYVSDEMKSKEEEINSAGIFTLNELGLDPGIDHMSAMQIMDKIKNEGGELYSFISSTGGLVAPDCDNNPWNYKFSWNPRNVVLAGQGTAQYLQEGNLKYTTYTKLFENTFEINIPKYGKFEVYPNRDSIKYIDIYNLQNIKTLIRGTIRKVGYPKAWNIFAQLGITDDTYIVKNSENLTYKEFILSYIPQSFIKNNDAEFSIKNYLNIEDDEIIYKLKWLGILSDKKIEIANTTPAKILQNILEERWKLEENDRDMIVMQHEFKYQKEYKDYKITSSMAIEGKNQIDTAMAQTVGLPIAIATKLILTNQLQLKGIELPIKEEIYTPIMQELKQYEVEFIEEQEEIM